MSIVRHWMALRTLSIVGVAALTMLSVVVLEEGVKRSAWVAIYLLLPAALHIGCCLFVSVGVPLMRLNDSLLGSTASFQSTWFLRVMAFLGTILTAFALAQLIDLDSGYIPFMFSSGTAFLWSSCYHMEKLKSEQAGDGDAPQRPC